jgi:hypothetical protein
MRLLRMMARFELPAPFDGWCLHSGKLWTPEGHGIEPRDGVWWSLLVRQARCFRTLYQRQAGFDVALRAASATEGTRSAGGAGAVAARASGAPHEAVGGLGSSSAMRKSIRVESPLVITGSTLGLPQSEIQEVRQ